MLTGGQVKSFSGSGETTLGAPSAGASDLPPPKRLLKRSVSDCDDAGVASMPQPIPSKTAADIAILRRRAAVMISRSSPIRRPCHLTPSDHLAPGGGRVITAQWRRTQGKRQHPKTRSAAKILMQQAEQQMILPDAVDAEIAPRQALAGKTAFLQHPDRCRIGGNAAGLDPIQIDLANHARQ